MIEHLPQLLWLLLTAVASVHEWHVDGQPYTGNHSVVRFACSTTLGLLILAWGGFFD